MDHLVLDIEIQRTIGGPEGLTWDDTDKLGVSVAVIYEMDADRYLIYGPDDIQDLRARLEAAERITTWNGDTFDLPVIYGLRRPMVVEHLAQTSDDLLQRTWHALGSREKGWKLEDVARAMLGRGKTGDGALAPILFQQSRWVRLINYCLEDVRITRDILRVLEQTGEIHNGVTTLTLLPWTGA
jgi:DEAD/DEAH box helicase domain-containing protein